MAGKDQATNLAQKQATQYKQQNMVETGVGNQNLLSSEPGSQRGTIGIQGVWEDPLTSMASLYDPKQMSGDEIHSNNNKFIPEIDQTKYKSLWDGIGVNQEAARKTWGAEAIVGTEDLAIESPAVQLTGAGVPFGTPTGPNDTSDEEELFT